MTNTQNSSENSSPQVSQEFVSAVKKYLEIDNLLKDVKEKSKIFTIDKKKYEDYILEYLQNINETVIDIYDGKLRKNVSKTTQPLKKEFIQKALVELTGDSLKACEITDKIIKSRPVVEKITLKRTKTISKKNIQDI